MAKESTVARESRVNQLNEVSRVSTRRLIKGWASTYAPKSQSVKVGDWLRENQFHVNDSELEGIGNTTFRDYGRERDRFYYLDTFIRDAIDAGYDSIRRKR